MLDNLVNAIPFEAHLPQFGRYPEPCVELPHIGEKIPGCALVGARWRRYVQSPSQAGVFWRRDIEIVFDHPREQDGADHPMGQAVKSADRVGKTVDRAE